MPDKLEIYSCKFCGAEFAFARGANEVMNCEHGHLHMKDIALDIIMKPGDDLFCYQPRSIWPTFIRVKCTSRAIEPAVYQLVGSRRKHGRTGTPGGIVG